MEVDGVVLACDEETAEIGYYPITAVWVHEDPVIVYLTIEGETILTTPEHPFYIEEGEWIAAGKLQTGDEIRTSDWETGTVKSVHFVARPQTLYNLTVATANTFFVGNGQWLVHNTCRGFAPGKWLNQYQKHSDEFPEYSTSMEYLRGAQRLTSGQSGTWTFSRANGDRLFYNATTNEFGVLSVDQMTIRTYFRPENGWQYWLSQTGGTGGILIP